jgi:apolipoprotein N-acyltransferase
MTMPLTARREQPASSSTAPRLRSALVCVAAAFLTSGLLWLSYFPASQGWLAWVALVPWLLLVRAEVPSCYRYLIAWLVGLAFFVPALSWMRVAHKQMFYSWLGLALYCSWFFPLALWLLRRLDRRTRLPLTFTVPIVWVALEYFRSTFAGGFSWYLLGQTQHDFPAVIQIADLAGVAAVTALVAAVNGLAAEALGRFAARRAWFAQPATRVAGWRQLRPQAMAVGVVLLVVLAYGGWRLSQSDFAEGPCVALLQTNLLQGDRLAADEASPEHDSANDSVEAQTAKLTIRALQAPAKPDLIVWPETSFPYDWKEVAAGAPTGPALDEWQNDLRFRQDIARRVAANAGTNVLLGLNTQIFGTAGRGRRYNSAMLLSPDGGAVARYDKMHLVPFGEYVPFRDAIPLLKWLTPYGDYEYSLEAGDTATRFHLPAGGHEYRFGVLICYEDADAPLAREYTRPGQEPPVDFLVNISNDGWFMGTPEHAEHLAVSRFRAVENRRALLRAANGGISAVIDGNGRVVALPAATWAASHSVMAVVSAAVPIDSRSSLYARVGDWLPWGCWGLLLVGCCWRGGWNRS